MAKPFLYLYDFFAAHRRLFWVVFVGIVMVLGLVASQIKIEEDITKFFPDDERVEKLNYVFQNSKFVERLVVMVSVKDSSTLPQPDSLVAITEVLAAQIENDLKPHIKKITTQLDDSKVLEVFKTVHDFLPVFLDDNDYRQLDSLTKSEMAKRSLEENYQQLISPSGVVMKRVIVEDPLGFSFLVLKKLKELQYDENFELYDNFVITKDHRHILFFIQPMYAPAETGNNTKFLTALRQIIQEESTKHPEVLLSYFGGAVVAVDNATQLTADTILTVSLMVVLLIVFLVGYFRKKRVPFILLIPVFFGALFALCMIYLLKGSVSILALAVGAIILGVAIDYALHFLVHLKHNHDVRLVIKDLAQPLTIGSTTTVLAFLSLQFVNAAVLRDVGLFAGFSLVGAALSSLIFLPHLISENLFQHEVHRTSWMDRIFISEHTSNKYVVYTILIATPFFLYFSGKVNFNTDLNALNFMTEETSLAQDRLESLNQSSLRSMYVVSSGNTLQEALRKNEVVSPLLDQLKEEGKIQKYSTVSSFMISDSLQRIRINQWNAFWTNQRKSDLMKVVEEEGKRLKYSDKVIHNFDTLISRKYTPATKEDLQPIRTAFFDDFIIEKNKTATVISLAHVDPSNKAHVYDVLKNSPASAFDRQMLTNLFVEFVHADFNFIVAFTSILVFVALLISYGRIELTLITFIPMVFTWIWILGIMALAGIEFNIVNVLVSTFIFGLGDDYSIFIMDGLQQEYITGKKNLPSIRTSILLSALTTIAGLGVLIFAQHPALRSIAGIAIIGIACVFIMAQTMEPFFFRLLITNRVAKGFTPVTALGFLRTFFTYTFFVGGALILTVIGLLLKLIPFGRNHIRLFYHKLLRAVTWFLIYVEPNVKKRIIGKTDRTYSRASVIIANHTSFLDILLTIMMNPKVVLLTNKWVWNSPVFGGVARLADFYPVMDGAEDSIGRLKDRVDEGYSVVVFPEGTRSEDGKIKRFHKGAFFMAEELKLPIQPLLIHGASDAIPKGSFYLNEGELTLKYLPPIEVNDNRFGEGYAQRTKDISKYFKKEFESLSREIETPDYFKYRLITNYLYKGPVLEWYMRIKLKLEKNYVPFENLIPAKATILDLGCGYGFLPYMLQFMSDERTITGVDYDEDKIATANHGYLKTDRLQFFCADVAVFPLAKYDVIIISDVLHYLQTEAQDKLLINCFDALNARGTLIIRDGNADLKERHKGTKLTEFFSVKLLKFNKSENDLNFVSGERIKQLAAQYGLKVTELDDAKFTSNVIFVVRKDS
ncbi:MAG TPA: 1-acyl-sn-glycerol-3-phosphate acyltransferase [Chryseolinea sp.]|nr:1-acyl-sn-glycerol-3-phosphate acyltransferase [Chryseolinea sp.]HPM31132.1 1-acyl-sn-glycerol-3-phosphate acyltransferase [Chryseolinea sp.]